MTALRAFIRENAHRRPTSSQRTAGLVNRLGRVVSEDIAVFKFNTAIAKMMETLNALGDETLAVADGELANLVKILAPIAPFLAEECWEVLGRKGSVHLERWPVYDPSLELEEKITVAVQVNGKLRGTLDVERGETQEEVAGRAAALDSVARHLEGKQVVKTIYVPERTLNFVVK